MDKNQIIGIVLMVLLYIGYIWYTAPTEEDRIAAIAEQERLAEEARLDSLAAVNEAAFQAQLRESTAAADSVQTSTEIDATMLRRFGGLASAAIGEETSYALASEQVNMSFSSRGGVPVSATLPKFNRYNSEEPVQLWEQRTRCVV